MVWPILISVAVTPRISAALDAAGHTSAASVPTTPALVTKRIDAPPLLFGARLRPRSRHDGTCHDANMDANRNHGETHRRKKARLEAGLFTMARRNSRPYRTKLCLRLRLQTGIRIGTRAWLAGR